MRNINYKHPSTIPLPGENLKTTARLIRTYSDLVFALTTKVSIILLYLNLGDPSLFTPPT